MKYVPFLFLFLFSAACFAEDRYVASMNRGLADFRQGKSNFQNANYPEARRWFQKSLSDFEDASGSSDSDFAQHNGENAALLSRWVTATYCEERRNSFDQEVLRDLIGENRGAPSNYYHGTCSQFPDSPWVEKEIRARISWLENRSGSPPQSSKLNLDSHNEPANDPDLYTNTQACRSDRNDRDAKGCFAGGVDRGSGNYSFRLSGCPGGSYLATIFITDQNGVCTRQVKEFNGSNTVSVFSPGQVPTVRDAIVLRPGDGIRECYIKRQQGHACVAQ